MSLYNTTSRDDYRDPRTYNASDSISPNDDARARRRNQYHGSPTSHQDYDSRKVPLTTATAHISPLKQASSSTLANLSPGPSNMPALKERREIADCGVGDPVVQKAAKTARGGEGSVQGSNKTEGSSINQALLDLEDQIRATIYGHCIGDAIGLLTEFMNKDEAHQVKISVKSL